MRTLNLPVLLLLSTVALARSHEKDIPLNTKDISTINTKDISINTNLNKENSNQNIQNALFSESIPKIEQPQEKHKVLNKILIVTGITLVIFPGFYIVYQHWYMRLGPAHYTLSQYVMIGLSTGSGVSLLGYVGYNKFIKRAGDTFDTMNGILKNIGNIKLDDMPFIAQIGYMYINLTYNILDKILSEFQKKKKIPKSVIDTFNKMKLKNKNDAYIFLRNKLWDIEFNEYYNNCLDKPNALLNTLECYAGEEFLNEESQKKFLAITNQLKYSASGIAEEIKKKGGAKIVYNKVKEWFLANNKSTPSMIDQGKSFMSNIVNTAQNLASFTKGEGQLFEKVVDDVSSKAIGVLYNHAYADFEREIDKINDKNKLLDNARKYINNNFNDPIKTQLFQKVINIAQSTDIASIRASCKTIIGAECDLKKYISNTIDEIKKDIFKAVDDKTNPLLTKLDTLLEQVLDPVYLTYTKKIDSADSLISLKTAMRGCVRDIISKYTGTPDKIAKMSTVINAKAAAINYNDLDQAKADCKDIVGRYSGNISKVLANVNDTIIRINSLIDTGAEYAGILTFHTSDLNFDNMNDDTVRELAKTLGIALSDPRNITKVRSEIKEKHLRTYVKNIIYGPDWAEFDSYTYNAISWDEKKTKLKDIIKNLVANDKQDVYNTKLNKIQPTPGSGSQDTPPTPPQNQFNTFLSELKAEIASNGIIAQKVTEAINALESGLWDRSHMIDPELDQAINEHNAGHNNLLKKLIVKRLIYKNDMLDYFSNNMAKNDLITAQINYFNNIDNLNADSNDLPVLNFENSNLLELKDLNERELKHLKFKLLSLHIECKFYTILTKLTTHGALFVREALANQMYDIGRRVYGNRRHLSDEELEKVRKSILMEGMKIQSGIQPNQNQGAADRGSAAAAGAGPTPAANANTQIATVDTAAPSTMSTLIDSASASATAAAAAARSFFTSSATHTSAPSTSAQRSTLGNNLRRRGGI